MKTIGIIGGLSWLSTIDYYKAINEQVNQRLGGAQAAKIILYSVNFGEIKALTEQNDWPAITNLICDAAKKLEAAGSNCLLLAVNTMHKIAAEVKASITIPLIHIAEVTAEAANQKQFKKVALLGTKFTMELPFYPEALATHGIEMIIPGDEDRDYIHASIYDELGIGIFAPATKARYQQIIQQLKDQGAEAVILGCTEIPLLIKEEDSVLPLLNTILIHSTAAVEFALLKKSPK